MKRTVLILALCLSVQMSAMSAPFAHVHADAGHETDHHHGRTSHRHVAGHDSTAHHDRGHIDTDHRQAGEDGSPHVTVTVTGAEVDAQFLGGVTAARATSITSIADPVNTCVLTSPSPSAFPGERLGPPIPGPPDISPPPLRGPPR